MPRFRNCVLCGNPIPRQKPNGRKTRIDCIYCSESCCTLACNARHGKRWEGRRKLGDTPPPGEYIPRAALPLVTVRLNATLDAALLRIAELEQQFGDLIARGNDEQAAKGAGSATGLFVLLPSPDKAPDPDPPTAGANAVESAAQNAMDTVADLPSETEWLRIEWAATKRQVAAEVAEKERMRAEWADEKEKLKAQYEQQPTDWKDDLVYQFNNVEWQYGWLSDTDDLVVRYARALSELQLAEYLGDQESKQTADLHEKLDAETKARKWLAESQKAMQTELEVLRTERTAERKRLDDAREQKRRAEEERVAAQREVGVLQEHIQDQARRHGEELVIASRANSSLSELNQQWKKANVELQTEARNQKQRADKAADALAQLQTSMNAPRRESSPLPAARSQWKKRASRKLLPAAAKHDQLMKLMKQTVSLQRQIGAARGLKRAGKQANTLTIARQLAKEARQRFVARSLRAGWVVEERLLDEDSEKALHGEQKNQIQLLQRELANAKQQARQNKKDEAARARLQAHKDGRSRRASGPSKTKSRRTEVTSKRLPSAAKNDKLMALMKNKVTLLRKRDAAEGIRRVGKQPNLLTVAREMAKKLRHWFVGAVLGVAGAAVTWVVRDRLLDARSEKRLYEEQKQDFKHLQRQVAPLLRGAQRTKQRKAA